MRWRRPHHYNPDASPQGCKLAHFDGVGLVWFPIFRSRVGRARDKPVQRHQLLLRVKSTRQRRLRSKSGVGETAEAIDEKSDIRARTSGVEGIPVVADPDSAQPGKATFCIDNVLALFGQINIRVWASQEDAGADARSPNLPVGNVRVSAAEIVIDRNGLKTTDRRPIECHDHRRSRLDGLMRIEDRIDSVR